MTEIVAWGVLVVVVGGVALYWWWSGRPDALDGEWGDDQWLG